MKFAIGMIVGIVTPSILRLIWDVAMISIDATKFTYRRFRQGLKPGYSRWNWFYLIPRLWWDGFKTAFMDGTQFD